MNHGARSMCRDSRYGLRRSSRLVRLLRAGLFVAFAAAGIAWAGPAAAATLQVSGDNAKTVTEATGTVSFTVVLMPAGETWVPMCTIQGKLVPAGGTATGADYDVSGSTFTINLAGSDAPPVAGVPIATASASIDIIDDGVHEATETADFAIAVTFEDCSLNSGDTFLVHAGGTAATVSIVDSDTPASASVSSLTLRALPGQTASAHFAVTDDSPPIAVSTDLDGASVTPEVIESSAGTVSVSFDVPATAQIGDTYSGNIFLADSGSAGGGDVTTIPVTIRVETGIADNPRLTDNQRSTAKAMDTACGAIADMPAEQRTAGQQDLLNTCEKVQSSHSPGALLDQLSQQEVAAQRRMTLSTMQGQLNNVGGRINKLRHGASGLDISGLSLQLDDQFVPGSLLQYAANGVLRDVDGRGIDLQSFNRLGVYINGSIAHGSRDSTSREDGYDTDIWNLTAGSDYRFTDRWVSGLAFGYGHNDTQFDSESGGVDLDSYTLSVYGSYSHPDGYYFDAIATYGRNDYDVARRLDLDGTGLTADGDPNGNEYLFSLDGGYDISRKALTIGLQARVVYLNARIDGYDETASNPTAPGAGSLLHIDAQDADSLTSELLTQLSYAISTGIGVISPTVRVGWEHEFLGDSQFISARFLSDPTNTSFKVRTDNPDRDYFNLGTGISAQFTQGRSAFLFVETTQGHDNIHYYAIEGGIRLSF